VTRQVSTLLRIRAEYDPEGISDGKNDETILANMNNSSQSHIMSGADGGGNNKMNVSSSSSGPGGGGKSSQPSCAHHSSTDKKKQRNENKQQAIIELMLTALPPTPMPINSSLNATVVEEDDENIRFHRRRQIRIFGNLARELVQTYHALARNEIVFHSPPESLLSNRDAIVYINNHIAVYIEAASARPVQCRIGSYSSQLGQQFVDHTHIAGQAHSTKIPRSVGKSIPFIRSYHTLLFPHAPPSELLQTISSSSQSTNGMEEQHHAGPQDSSQQRLEKLLLVASPFKSLNEMATEAALPLPVIIEIAASLVESGTCISVPVMTSATRFVCQDSAIKRITSLSLIFAQRFGPLVSIFMAVSAATASLASNDLEDSSSTDHKDRIGTASNDFCGHASPITLGDVMDFLCKKIESSSNVESSDDNDSKSEIIPIVFEILADKISETLRSKRIPPGFKHSEYCLLPQTQFHFSGGYTAVTNHAMPILTSGVIGGIEMGGGTDAGANGQVLRKAIYEALIAMIVWLRAHSVIVELKEYLTSVSRPETDHIISKIPSTKGSSESPSNGMNKSLRSYSDFESLYKGLSSEGYLSGNISNIALAWRFRLSLRRLEAFREWGVREKVLLAITRTPVEGDDWGAP